MAPRGETWTLMTGLAPVMRRTRLTQRALAKRLGVTPQTIYRWRAGETLPDLPTLFLLADVLDVAPVELIPSLGVAPTQLALHAAAQEAL